MQFSFWKFIGICEGKITDEFSHGYESWRHGYNIKYTLVQNASRTSAKQHKMIIGDKKKASVSNNNTHEH